MKTQKRNDNGVRTSESVSIRAIEGEGNERKFTLSFSSEIAVSRGWGQEILDHSEGAVDLSRIEEMGCLLFNHNRDIVIGKITRAWIEDNRGYAEVEFDDDEFSEKIRKKVASRTLTGVSVGYRVDSWEEVMPGKISADGKFTGPCDIARKWTPMEISIVSIPADHTVGVGRTMDFEENQKPAHVPEGKQKRTLEYYERQLQININHLRRTIQ